MTITHAVEVLPTTEENMLEVIRRAETLSREHPQVDIHTTHLLHAGMYVRTITLPPNTALIGVLIKLPTVVVTIGSASVLVGKAWQSVDGVRVLPAEAGRKQVFVSRSAFVISMMFPTDAQTVEEAEAQFTDDADSLLSRQQGFTVLESL